MNALNHTMNAAREAASTAGEAANGKVMLLGLDVHLKSYVVSRMEDGKLTIPQKFSPEAFLTWVKKPVARGYQIWSCYEAGPFGYVLHRKLEGMGVRNLVIAPRDWDENHRQVKTDKTDAQALVRHLDQYVRGNENALMVVRIPEAEAELDRAESRMRDQVLKERKRYEARGRSLLLTQGIRLKIKWWKERGWKEVQAQASSRVVALLENLRQLLLPTHEMVKKLTRQLEESSPERRIKGVGALTQTQLDREIGDWNRFKNRREIASYAGLCPSIHASGGSRREGPISKHGNPKVRQAVIEAVWRLLVFQPDYPPIAKRRELFRPGKTGAGAKKKAVVAIGHQLIIDIWRYRTGQLQNKNRLLEIVG